MKTAEKVASSIGKGLVAGFAGTAAMTVSSTLEARLRGRAPSTAPARATAKALGIASFEDAIAQARLNDLSHWGYGTGWGIVRGLLDAAGLPPAKATAAHGAAVWGSAQVTLPALEVAPPIVFWPRQEIAIDAFHHTVYAVATGVAYELLELAQRASALRRTAQVYFVGAAKPRRHDRSVVLRGGQPRTLTARAITSRVVIRAISDWIAISSFASALSGSVSVGLNAVAFVYDVYR